MELTLDLKPEVEDALREYAAAEGLTIGELLARTFPPRTKATAAQHLDPRARVKALLSDWQGQDAAPYVVAAATPTDDASTTPSEALFQKWEREDADLTKEEREAQAEHWRQFQQDVNIARAAGMRLIF